jgi:hypothetical protein
MKKSKSTQTQIIGSFNDIIKASVSGNPKPKTKKKKAAKNRSTK